jgi:hypothetical protein
LVALRPTNILFDTTIWKEMGSNLDGAIAN